MGAHQLGGVATELTVWWRMTSEPFKDRTSKDEALALLGTLLRQPCASLDNRTLKAAEVAARLYLADAKDSAEKGMGQTLWTTLAEARKFRRPGTRLSRVTMQLLQKGLQELKLHQPHA